MQDYLKLPHAEAGQRIGLFGGSFNPAHEGHRLVALECLKRLELDAVWLLVSPGNPLKDHAELAPLEERVAQVVKVMDDPRLKVTAFEQARGFTYTFETLSYLVGARDDLHFVWIMGSDSLASFDRWQHWQEIAALAPLAVYARPGTTLTAVRSKAARALAAARLPEAAAPMLADRAPPAWVYLRGVMSPASSTAIRKSRARATK